MTDYTDTELLNALLKHFYFRRVDRGLQWQWKEYLALHEVEDDPEIVRALQERAEKVLGEGKEGS